MKRSSNRAAARASLKLEKARGMGVPGGKSKYARKKIGSYMPDKKPQRPCWFMREGWDRSVRSAARADEQARRAA